MENTPGFGENKAESEFKERYDEITSRQLSPMNLDYYEKEALNDLIVLVEDVLEKHKWDMTSKRDWEDRALIEEGLSENGRPGLSKKLDQLQENIEQVEIAKKRVNDAFEEDYEILPEEEGEGKRSSREVNPKRESSSSPEYQPRTETIVFLLNQIFGEDIGETGSIDIVKGQPAELRNSRGEKTGDRDWARRYYCIHAPNQNKYILACNKNGNATFVIDKNDLTNLRDEDDNPIDIEDLKKMTKKQVGALVKNQERMPNSQRVICRGTSYTDNVRRAIENRPQKDPDSPSTESGFLNG